MLNVLLGCVIGFVFVCCACVPLFAPWRMRIWYLVNAPVGDPVLGLGGAPGVTLREVTLSSVETCAGRVEFAVDGVGAGRGMYRRTFRRDDCTPGEVARLDGWSATRVPLLLVVDEAGDTHLFGPDGSLTNVVPVPAQIR